MQPSEICQAMMKFALQFPEIRSLPALQLENFSDGLPFALMLLSSNTIDLSLSELQPAGGKWIGRVSNLKKLLSKIQVFLEKANEKTDRLRQIDVVEIAKHSSPHHIARLFEVIVSVLMNSPHKQKYIQLIMALDETSQNTFVEIIQNSLDQQLFANEEPQGVQLQQEIRELKEQNAQLKGEVNDLQRKNKNLVREVKDLKEKIINYQEQLEQAKTADVSVNSDGIHTQLEQQRVLIDNLKARLMATVRENELEMSQMREQISVLRLKTQNYQDLESTLEEYKELYSQTTAELLRMGQLERDKRKLQRTIEEKEQMIRKLQDKIEASLEKNYTLEENQIYMKLELEKREVRFKQLQKEVKTRLKSEPSEPLHQKDKEQKELKEQKQMKEMQIEGEIRDQQNEEISYLQEELERARQARKELEKENIKNRKRLERMTQMEAEKKKLEKIVLEVNRSKDSQIEMLVVSLHELRNENIKLFSLLHPSP